MNPHSHVALCAIAGAFVLSGCTSSRPTEREVFFTPVVRSVVSMNAPRPTAATDSTIRALELALSESRREVLALRLDVYGLRDSLYALMAQARSRESRTQELADRVQQLEQRAPMATNIPRAARPETTVPAGPVSDPLRPEVTVLKSTEPPVRRTAAILRLEYEEAFALFQGRRYDQARSWLSRLLEEGIPEDLADNCQYWIGECEAAMSRWTNAVTSFERVIALSGSNKRADAMFMLGKSYESLRQIARARATYERLLREMPSSPLAGAARKRLNATQPAVSQPTAKRIES